MRGKRVTREQATGLDCGLYGSTLECADLSALFVRNRFDFQLKVLSAKAVTSHRTPNLLPSVIGGMAGFDGHKRAAAGGRHFIVRDQFTFYHRAIVR